MKQVRDERGIALLLVIWLLVILAALAAEMAMSARGDIGAVRNFKEGREAYYLARAGAQMAFAELLEDFDYVYAKDGQDVLGRVGDDLKEPEFAPRQVKLGGGLAGYVITDENAKLNLNALARDEGGLRRLFAALFPDKIDGEDAAIDGILDWADADEYHRANGAESDYYQTLKPPYKAKNGDFDSVAELRRVKGISPKIFAALEKVLTVYSAGALNPNTATPEALLASGVPQDKVDAIMDARAHNAPPDPNGKSDTFVIVATGRFEGSALTHSVRVVVRKTAPRRLTLLDWADDFYDVFVRKKEPVIAQPPAR
ncbi:MAG: general secretion pathway protein GspK [Nitrospinae bacterium]|nr:general secretion pathway protein GspK [Nitrospinota bacterium]